MSLLKTVRHQRRHKDRDTETGIEERRESEVARTSPWKSPVKTINTLIEKNQEEQRIKMA